jgi:hypothetical protein
MINSVTFTIFSPSLLPALWFVVTEPIALTIIMDKKAMLFSYSDESVREKPAVKLRVEGDLSGDYRV